MPRNRIWCGLFLILGPGTAWAQGASPAVLAESLFADGKRLMQAGDLAQACPKLAESFRIDPASGTLLALALCHERQGKTATAWGEYKQAQALAHKGQRAERERAARERAEELERTLSRITILVPSGAPSALEIRLEGVVLTRASWGVPLPVDPGESWLSASAPGFQEARIQVRVQPGSSSQEVHVPQLLPVPPLAVSSAPSVSAVPSALPLVPSSSAEPVPSPGPVAPGRSSWGVGLGTAGGIAVLGSVLLGAYAWSRSSYARDLCPDNPCSDARALDANQSADRAAVGANVAFGVGLVALGSAAVFWWLDREKTATAFRSGAFRF